MTVYTWVAILYVAHMPCLSGPLQLAPAGLLCAADKSRPAAALDAGGGQGAFLVPAVLVIGFLGTPSILSPSQSEAPMRLNQAQIRPKQGLFGPCFGMGVVLKGVSWNFMN